MQQHRIPSPVHPLPLPSQMLISPTFLTRLIQLLRDPRRKALLTPLMQHLCWRNKVRQHSSTARLVYHPLSSVSPSSSFCSTCCVCAKPFKRSSPTSRTRSRHIFFLSLMSTTRRKRWKSVRVGFGGEVRCRGDTGSYHRRVVTSLCSRYFCDSASWRRSDRRRYRGTRTISLT